MNRLAALVALATLATTAFGQAPDPGVVQAIRLLRDGSDEEQARAIRDLKELGPLSAPAIPALTEALREGSEGRRAEIAKLLASHGPAAKEAIPVLVSLIRARQARGDFFIEAANAIAALGDPGNRDLVRMCLFEESQGRGGRRVTAAFPEYLPRHAAATIPTIADLMLEPDRVTRHWAAISMARLVARPAAGKPSPLVELPPAVQERAVAALRATLDDPDSGTRAWAAAGLIDVDPTSLPQAVPAILAAIRRRDGRYGETGALIRTGSAGARFVIEHLDEPNAGQRQTIVQYLAQFGEDALPALAEGLRHPNPVVREAVVRTLQFGNRWNKLRTELSTRLHDPDAGVRLAAAAVLASNEPARAGATVPVLSALAFDRNPSYRVEALSVLRQLGPVARPAVPDLLRRVQSGDIDTRLTAAEALMMADRTTWRSFVPVFVAALPTEHTGRRQRAINRLRDTGPDARAALPALRKCMEDEYTNNRVLAAEAILKIDPTAIADALACLIAVINDRGAQGRQNFRAWRTALRALERLGPAAKSAVPALLELIRFDVDSDIGPDAAVVAIRLDPDHAGELYDMFRTHLSPGYPDPDEQWLVKLPDLKNLAKPLLPELIAALRAKNREQRDAAFDTLTALGPDAKDALPTLRELVKAKKDAARVTEIIKAIEKK